jgi:formylglycine-generating enzyme required for sulfatase activity
VTVGAYRRFAEATGRRMPDEPVAFGRKLNPGWGDKEQPMVMVTWEEAKFYCESWAKGWLPTEAEWEYAARAGTAGARYGHLEAIAWHGDNSGGRIHRVKEKQPNPWGLYDILGNVWEWVADWYEEGYYGTLPPGAIDPKGPSSGKQRVLRGGSWLDDERVLRAAVRLEVGPVDRYNYLGFRCAREVIP